MQRIFFNRNAKGFSLVETVVALGIFSLLITGIVGVFINSNRYQSIIFDQLLAQSEGRKAVQDFINDIRRANYSSIGAYPIVVAGTSTVTFYSDIDNDTYREKVRYFLTGRTLKKGVIKPSGVPLSYPTSSEVVVDEVHYVANTSSVFYYYDQDYTGSATSTALVQPVNVSNVRLVEIRLEIEKDPNKSPVPLYVQTKTEIRNLKKN